MQPPLLLAAKKKPHKSSILHFLRANFTAISLN